MQQQQLPPLILIEAALGVTWCNGCQSEKRSSLTINGNFVLIEPNTTPLGTTKVINPFTRTPRTFNVITPNDVHTCKTQ